jgi:hypothetical protein
MDRDTNMELCMVTLLEVNINKNISLPLKYDLFMLLQNTDLIII